MQSSLSGADVDLAISVLIHSATQSACSASVPMPRQPLPHVPPINGMLLAHTVVASLVSEHALPSSVPARNWAEVNSALLATHCETELPPAAPLEPALFELPPSLSLPQPTS